MNRPYLLIPLVCSLLYTVGALLCKRASRYGPGPWRITFVCNLVGALAYQPLWLTHPAPAAPGPAAATPAGPGDDLLAWLLTPALTTATCLVGQILTFFSLEIGDVSIVTPMLGTKVLFVALFTGPLLHQRLPAVWWAGAGLTMLAVLVLSRSRPSAPAAAVPPPVATGVEAVAAQRGAAARRERNRSAPVLVTLLVAATSAAAFALTDVFYQKWGSSAGGVNRFLPQVGLGLAVGSAVLVPLFRGRLFSPETRGAWRWLLPGAVILAVQGLTMALGLGRFGDATGMNIVYGCRGLWSVLLVWWAGAWFDNEEGRLGPAVLLVRLAGASLLVAAVVLVMTSGGR